MNNSGNLARNFVATAIILAFAVMSTMYALKEHVRREPDIQMSNTESGSPLANLSPITVQPDLEPTAGVVTESSGLPDMTAEIDAKVPRMEDIKPLPLPEIPDEPPHEGAMWNVPLVVQPPDVLIVEVLESLPGRPITGEHLVRPDGTINLGFYGDVYVRGLTARQVKELVVLQLRKYITDEALGLVGARVETGPNINGDKPTEPSQLLPEKDLKSPMLSPEKSPKAATIDANSFLFAGQAKNRRSSLIRLIGDRLPNDPPPTSLNPQRPTFNIQPRVDVPTLLQPSVKFSRFYIPPAESDRIVVDIASHNSGVYYVQGSVNSAGRFPFTGNETVLDAIQFAKNLSPNADPETLRIVRPAWGKKPAQIHPINLNAIRNHGDQSANLQILPGDRLIVDSKTLLSDDRLWSAESIDLCEF